MSSDGGDRPEVGHVQEYILGSSDAPRERPKRVYLRIVDSPVQWDPRPGLPAGGRNECRTGERPCPYVRCEWHLWRVDGRDRQGRRWRGGQPRTTLEPRWLEYPTPVCCGLDIVEAAERMRKSSSGYLMPLSVIGDAMGRSSSAVWLLVKQALAKLRAMRVMHELNEADAAKTLAEGCTRAPRGRNPT